MKRSTKSWLIVAGGLVAAGLLLFAIGMCMGGSYKVRDWIENGELSWDFGDVHLMGIGGSVKFNRRYPIYEGTVERTRIEGAEQADCLSFDIGGGKVKIRASEDGAYYFSSDDAKKYQCYAENGMIELRARGGSWVINQSEDHVITLWLPAGVEYRRIDLELGGGILEAGTLSGSEIFVDAGGGLITADSLSGGQIGLELGAGEIRLQSVEAERFAIDIGAGELSVAALSAQKLDMDIGAGQAALESSVVHDVDMSVGMGQIHYSGAITGNLDADCSMGQIALELQGTKKEHNYEIECSMGDVKIDGESLSGMALSRNLDFGASSDFDLDCSMGSICVTFAD